MIARMVLSLFYGIWESKYRDQMHPDYIIFFHDEDHLARFRQINETVRKLPPEQRRPLFDERNSLAGVDIDSNSLSWIYSDGEWAMTLDEVIEEETGNRLQEEDDDFYQAQREHFAGQPKDEGGFAIEDQSRRMQRDAWPLRRFAKPLSRKARVGSSSTVSAFASLKLGYGETQSAKDERKRALPMYYVYLLSCANSSSYVGCTDDLKARI